MPSDTILRNRLRRTAFFAALAVASAAPAAAQSGGERVGDWTISPIGAAQSGNVCSATRLYEGGYALEVTQARGLPGQLIMRLESPKIIWRPGQRGENIADPYGLIIVINGIAGEEGPEAVIRQGPRGLGFVTTLQEGDDGPKFSPVRNLRVGRSVHAYIGAIDEEVTVIGDYSLAGSGAALDALAHCVNREGE